MQPPRLEDTDDLPGAVLDVLGEPDGEARLRRTYHAWQMHDPERAGELARVVAASLGRGGLHTDAAVLAFFAHLPRAPGGDGIVAAVVSAPERFDGEQAPDLDQALQVALSIGGDFAPADPGLLEVARAEVLAGRGQRLLYPLWRKDAAWMHEHVDTVLRSAPGWVDATFYGLVDRGVAPEDALQRVLEAADDQGRRRLSEQIDWTTIFDRDVRERLQAMLEAAAGP